MTTETELILWRLGGHPLPGDYVIVQLGAPPDIPKIGLVTDRDGNTVTVSVPEAFKKGTGATPITMPISRVLGPSSRDPLGYKREVL